MTIPNILCGVHHPSGAANHSILLFVVRKPCRKATKKCIVSTFYSYVVYFYFSRLIMFCGKLIFRGGKPLIIFILKKFLHSYSFAIK